MKGLTLEAAAKAMNGRIVGAGISGAERVYGAAVDSRRIREGELFFALRGSTDGADFAEDAHHRGAVAAVSPRPLEVPTLVVEDPLKALADLARHSLDSEDAPTVVGITGSVGKTTAKDALATLLRSSGRNAFATEGNYNNEIGLPLTILSSPHNTQTLVLEMGATHPGDIGYLCGIAPPEVGILTAISPAHLDSFGGMEGLASAKGELAVALPEDGIMVAPVGVPEAAVGYSRSFGRRIIFGGEEESGVTLWASDINEVQDGLSFTVHYVDETEEYSAEVSSPVFGTHLVETLLAAIGGGLALGLSLEECAGGLGRLRRAGLRGELYHLKDDILVYDDSYNASPAAVAAVLRYGADQAQSFRGGGGGRRRLVAVLGGMFELGACARDYHREIGDLAGELGVELLVCVGEEARWYAESFPGDSLLYDDAETACKRLKKFLRSGDHVVVKGSRGVGLERLTRELKESLTLV
jgi:UDP-N-acetylmuramoyl-tripeptide--D-alanyl-D-alanine ligase